MGPRDDTEPVEHPDDLPLRDGSRPVAVLTWADAMSLSRSFLAAGRSLGELFAKLDDHRSRSGRRALSASEVRLTAQAWSENLLTNLNARTCRDSFADMPPILHARRHLARRPSGTGTPRTRQFVIFDVVLLEPPGRNVDVLADRLRMSVLAKLVRERLEDLEVLAWATQFRVVAVAGATATLPAAAAEVAAQFTRELGSVQDPACCGVNSRLLDVPANPQEAIQLLESFLLS